MAKLAEIRDLGVYGRERLVLEQLNTWKPTQDELSKLRRLVNRKAGREIM